jgi:hypothetical protein
MPSPFTPRSNNASKAILFASLDCFSLVDEPVTVDFTEGLVVFFVGEDLEGDEEYTSGFSSGIGLEKVSSRYSNAWSRDSNWTYEADIWFIPCWFMGGKSERRRKL